MSMGSSSNEVCALCLEQKSEPVDLSCGHSFCRTCLDDLNSYRREQWARCCPLCRQPIGDSLVCGNDDDQVSISNGSIASDEPWEISESTSPGHFSIEDYDFEEESYYFYSDSDTSIEDAQIIGDTYQDNQEA